MTVTPSYRSPTGFVNERGEPVTESGAIVHDGQRYPTVPEPGRITGGVGGAPTTPFEPTAEPITEPITGGAVGDITGGVAGPMEKPLPTPEPTEQIAPPTAAEPAVTEQVETVDVPIRYSLANVVYISETYQEQLGDISTMPVTRIVAGKEVTKEATVKYVKDIATKPGTKGTVTFKQVREERLYPKGAFGASPGFARKLGVVTGEEERGAIERGDFFVITPDVVKSVKQVEQLSKYPAGTFVADPGFAEKGGFVTAEEAERARKAGESFVITPEAVTALKQREELELRKEELQQLAVEDRPKYYAAYVTSAWAAGPLSALGISLRTIADPFVEGKEEFGKVTPKEIGKAVTSDVSAAGLIYKTVAAAYLSGEEVAREKELTRFAERTLKFEEAPVKYTAKGVAQVPIIYAVTYGMGTIGAKAALAGTVKVGGAEVSKGAIFAYGTRAVSLSLTTKYLMEEVYELKTGEFGPMLVVREDADWTEFIARTGMVLAAIPFALAGYKAGVAHELERVEPLRLAKAAGLSPKETKEFLQKIETAKAAEKVAVRKPGSVKAVIKTIPAMKGKVGDVTYKHIKGSKGKLGGSVSQNVQIKGGRTPRDIDMFVKDPHGDVRALGKAYKAAGIKNVVVKTGYDQRTGDPTGSVRIKGYKVYESHPTSWLTEKMFFKGTVKSEEGIEVLSIRGQVFRKAIGPVEQPERIGRKKDIPDFQAMIKDIIQYGEIRAKESLPVLKGIRKTKVETLKDLMFGVDGKKGLAYPATPKRPRLPEWTFAIPTTKEGAYKPPTYAKPEAIVTPGAYPSALPYAKGAPMIYDMAYPGVTPTRPSAPAPYIPPTKEPTYAPPAPTPPPTPPTTYAPYYPGITPYSITTPPPTPPTYTPTPEAPFMLKMGLIKKEKKRRFKLPSVSAVKRKVPKRFSYPDLITAAASQARFGKATVPKFTPKEEYEFMRTGYTRVPTKEFQLAGLPTSKEKRRRSIF